MEVIWSHVLENVDAKLLATVAILILWDLRGCVKILVVQMATVVERVDSHEKRIDKLEI